MAIVDLTNVDPYAEETKTQARAYAQRNASLQGVFDKVTSGVQAGQARRAKLDEKNRAVRDREYALANKETDSLVQANTGDKFTDVQLQEVGMTIKQEYYDAVQEYGASDKGDEARRKFEEIKQTTLGSARTLGSALDGIGKQMDIYKELGGSGEMSDATNPASRSFFNDLNDPDTPTDQFQIVKDPETGKFKYKGTTSDGHEVDFFLDDFSSGDSDFSPVPKANMPGIMENLMKGVKDIKKQEKRENGVVEVTDWGAVGTALDGRFDQLFKDPKNFKAIAAGMGYDYDDIKNIENGNPVIGDNGEKIEDIDGLKAAMKEEMLMQIELTTPSEEKYIVGGDPNSLTNQFKEEKKEELQEKTLDNSRKQFSQIVKFKDGGEEAEKFFRFNLVGKNNVSHTKIKDGKLQLFSGQGKKAKALDQFDLSNPGDVARLQEFMGGANRNTSYTAGQQVERSNQFKGQLN